MTRHDLGFVKGVIQKNIVAGLCLSAILAYMVSVDFAVAALVGSIVASVNLVLGAWTTFRIIESGQQESAVGASGWALLLIGKLGVLFGVVWWLIAKVGLDALGFSVGFGSFLLAVLWQAAIAPPGGKTRDNDDKE
jgi:hypothetical protein